MTPYAPIQVIQVIQPINRFRVVDGTVVGYLDYLDRTWIAKKVAICRTLGLLGPLGPVYRISEEF